MMSEALMLGLAGVAGLLLGAIFFGGLWWTVRKGVASSRPALWFLGSLRAAHRRRAGRLVCCRGRVVGNGCWLCLLGFASRVSSSPGSPRHRSPPPKAGTAEARHAP
jgi:F1F0 ATPase subunit 2